MASSPGDFTGKQKEALAKKHAEEQQQRAGEMSMITAAQEQKKTREVVDYTKPKAAPAPDPGPIDLTGDGDEDGEGDELIDAIVAKATDEDAGPSAEEAQQRHPAAVAQQSTPVQVEKASSLVRARYDLPQVTIGHGNTYDFEEGRQYRVPPNVANHLAERALVDVLQ